MRPKAGWVRPERYATNGGAVTDIRATKRPSIGNKKRELGQKRTECDLEDEDRQADEEERHEVRDEERSASVVDGQRGEAPDVAKADSRADCSEVKGQP